MPRATSTSIAIIMIVCVGLCKCAGDEECLEEWTEWDACAPCDGSVDYSVQTRGRTCLDGIDLVNKKAIRPCTCKVKEVCVEQWSSWDACSPCGSAGSTPHSVQIAQRRCFEGKMLVMKKTMRPCKCPPPLEKCDEPVVPAHIARASCRGEFKQGQQCHFTCDTGYEFIYENPVSTITCLADGEWDKNVTPCKAIIDCGDWISTSPCLPCNDSVTTGLQFVKKRCMLRGEFVKEDSFQQCECKINNERCKEPPLADHVERGSCTGDFKTGMGCQVNCAAGYEFPEGTLPTLVCRSSGQWDKQVVACLLMKCPEPNLPESVERGGCSGNFNQGTGCKFTCQFGYEFADDAVSTLTCGPMGRWNGAVSDCTIITGCASWTQWTPCKSCSGDVSDYGIRRRYKTCRRETEFIKTDDRQSCKCREEEPCKPTSDWGECQMCDVGMSSFQTRFVICDERYMQLEHRNCTCTSIKKNYDTCEPWQPWSGCFYCNSTWTGRKLRFRACIGNLKQYLEHEHGDCECSLIVRDDGKEHPCDYRPCAEHGYCTELETPTGITSTCKCLPDYTGLQCETEIYKCQSSPCGKHGICLEDHDHYACACIDQYTGLHCTIKMNCSEWHPAVHCKNCTEPYLEQVCTTRNGHSETIFKLPDTPGKHDDLDHSEKHERRSKIKQTQPCTWSRCHNCYAGVGIQVQIGNCGMQMPETVLKRKCHCEDTYIQLYPSVWSDCDAKSCAVQGERMQKQHYRSISRSQIKEGDIIRVQKCYRDCEGIRQNRALSEVVEHFEWGPVRSPQAKVGKIVNGISLQDKGQQTWSTSAKFLTASVVTFVLIIIIFIIRGSNHRKNAIANIYIP